MDDEREVMEKEEAGVRRVRGYLHRVEPVFDRTGKVVQHLVTPLMVELRPRDVMQIIVGASTLAIPVGFTEEVWNLAGELPLANVLGVSAISLVFISLFVYFNFYRFQLRQHVFEYIKRVSAMYLLSLAVVTVLLVLIQRCPWSSDPMLALKRVLLVAFPSSMGAAISDVLK